MGLKYVILPCVFAIMAIGGIYAFRYLNNKLTSSSSTLALILYAFLLFMTIGGIYFGGILAMVRLSDYLTI